MGSPMEWGARVLLGEKRPRIHGPRETYAPRSFTSKARGTTMLHEFTHPERDSKYANRDWTRDWVYMGTQDENRELRFWVLTKQIDEVMNTVLGTRWVRNSTQYWKASARLVRIQTERVLERWTEICLRGAW